MTKNPIRDDKNRKMEVQKVLEALMKRVDHPSPIRQQVVAATVTRIKKAQKVKDKASKGRTKTKRNPDGIKDTKSENEDTAYGSGTGDQKSGDEESDGSEFFCYPE